MSADFFNAIKNGDLKAVSSLLSQDSSLIYAKAGGISPVLIAAYHHEPEIANFLAEKTGALTVFESSALGKSNQIMRLTAYNADLLNAYAEDGFQPLGLACYFGHYAAAEYLIKAGANVNSQSKNALQVAPLHSAAAQGHADIVTLLLNHNANPNVREQNGFTPLHTASHNGNLEIIRILLFNGADMAIESKAGKLALDVANEAGHLDAVALLKEGITRRFRIQKRS
ncbi:MAG: ankyrin repeat domain-containing protein [Anaerolineales bacterium]|nr:ankyrin repeat domain-containing protein [Anaerolineales bacterium]MCZ2121800.1 ankyrin repeat domain-containing protein [Anaerolineales bacterium]